ncbi:MAG: aminotransferase class I/II-fold pyridoxal phosphate-dependent enzyme [Anaerolineae bacterium]|nr:aminotransferase class I/II-fold pyridoxal phosphate-dependent enzyme [Anaerolineae bacterium]
MRPAKRITDLPPYPFASLGRVISEMTARGVDVIRLDIGSPDLPPAEPIIRALQEYAAKDTQHGYGGYFGTKRFRQAVASYYANRFGVQVDSETQVLPLIGSKEGIANIATAWLDPGDLALVPDPGYPTYSMGPVMVGAGYHPMPLREENGFLPDLQSIPGDVLNRARLMWLNYPNNPTGVAAPEEYLREAVDFCREHDLLLCFDAPYAENTYGGYRAPSILEVPGAIDVALEFNSLSKSHNLAGWRVAMAVGNREAVKALALVKSNVDSGIALPVQEMAIEALTGDQTWLEQRNAVYAERMEVAVAGLHRMGLNVRRPQGAIYVWTPVPKGWRSADFCQQLLEATGVSIAPGSTFGDCGEGYARISLVQPAGRIAEAMQRWEDWWSGRS